MYSCFHLTRLYSVQRETALAQRDRIALAASERIAADLRALGVHAGDVVLVHASFKSLGPVAGGLETVFCGLAESVGSEGTLLLPALSYMQEPHHIHDARSTPCCVGALPEYVRLRQGTLRSLHPTHSLCGIGRHAEALFAEHHRDRTPCGPHSPFRKMIDLGAKIVMLGCGLRPNTTMHALEECVVPPYVFGEQCIYHITDLQGHSYERAYVQHGFDGWIQRYDRVADLPQAADFMRRGRVLEAETYVIETPQLKEAAVEAMQQSPFYFVEREST